MAAIQDVVAVAIAVAAAAWLARGFFTSLGRPGCGTDRRRPADGPDGFVPIDRVATPKKGRETCRRDP